MLQEYVDKLMAQADAVLVIGVAGLAVLGALALYGMGRSLLGASWGMQDGGRRPRMPRGSMSKHHPHSHHKGPYT